MRGHLRVGVGGEGVMATELVAPALRQLRKNCPDLRLSLVQNTPEGFFNDLLEDTIDCAFPTLQARHLELVSHKLSTLEVGVVLPPGHRLAASREIPFKELSDEPWILTSREDNPARRTSLPVAHPWSNKRRSQEYIRLPLPDRPLPAKQNAKGAGNGGHQSTRPAHH
jgi:DNA-binding transcriptional LysR family regulator